MNTPSIPHFPLKTMRLLAALLTALALAGCGSDTPESKTTADSSPARTPPEAAGTAAKPDSMGATAPTARKPCEYMARADAEAAAGQPLPTTREDIAAGECDYLTADFFGATLRVGDWKDISYGATRGAQQPVSISGVGDEALNLNIPNQGSDLFVRKGDRGFHLGLSGPKIDGLPDHGLETEKVLALKILPNF